MGGFAVLALASLGVTAPTPARAQQPAQAAQSGQALQPGQALFDSGGVSYTDTQAARGRSAYVDNCAMCHGAHLDDGQFGPPVSGPTFRAQWHTQSAPALLSYLSTKMPPASPNSLPSQTYADIGAYLLQQNGEHAGAKELSAAEVAGAVGTVAGAASARRPGGDPYASLENNHDAIYRAVMAKRSAVLNQLTPVTAQTLANPSAADWLMWRGNYDSSGYSRLGQINKRNVADLNVAWSLALPVSGNEATPLVHDGVLFIASANTVEALNGADGSILWQYIRPLPPRMNNGRAAYVKSMAIYQDKLYAPTADGHLVALDVKSGRLLWDTSIVTGAQGVKVSGGPIVAHGKVIMGVSLGVNTAGGDFIVSLDGQTGAELWRFYTIARPGQPGGDSWNGAPVSQRYGAGVWSVGSYDPQLNLVYFGTGNTYDVGTLLLPQAQKGESNDALYTDSTLALDPDTGKLVWYYQHMNRDVWDLDWAFEQSLITLPIDGRPTKLVVTGGKLAIFDAVNRADGKYAFSKDSGLQNLVVRIDPKTGAKIVNPAIATPQPGRSDYICPSDHGGRDWIATSFDPTTDILYVPLLESCMNYRFVPRDPAQVGAGGVDIRYGANPPHGTDGKFGRIEAINLKTRQIVWTMRQRAPIESSMLASAGGLVFGGSHDRDFAAYDSANGKLLWHTTLNSAPSSSPVTYDAAGVQYVAVVAGGGSVLDSTGTTMTPEIDDPTGTTTLWVFKLRGSKPARQ
ncbi:MAG TPA: PQQ-binding-like beta-propeller repeat protein [Steroidobacteraceae bacterium]|nr:PQQ-binding-like beta-propeller repeat protein [Steroidobacteraceae bacterium]